MLGQRLFTLAKLKGKYIYLKFVTNLRFNLIMRTVITVVDVAIIIALKIALSILWQPFHCFALIFV